MLVSIMSATIRVEIIPIRMQIIPFRYVWAGNEFSIEMRSVRAISCVRKTHWVLIKSGYGDHFLIISMIREFILF